MGGGEAEGRFGSYRLGAILGSGGMGTVYLATDTRLGRQVALKVLGADLAGDPAFRDRFVAEARLAASLDHPHIVPVYEAGEADGRLFLAMRYVRGPGDGGEPVRADLAARLAAGGPLPVKRATALAAQIALALDAAHRAGLVHRDVKPANILVDTTSAAGAEHAYLADFGLTRRRAEAAGPTRPGQLLGTVAYVAPEQIEGGPVDGRTDVYALGCVLYELLAGVPPHRGDSDVAILMAHLRVTPPPLADVPPAVAAVVERALAKDPRDRFPTAGAMAAALVGQAGTIEAVPARAAPPARTRRAAWAAVAAGGVLALGLLAVALSGGFPGRQAASPRLAGVSPGAPASTPAALPGSAAPEPSPTVPDPAPALAAFPTEAEAVLLAQLPASLAATCQRGGRAEDAVLAGFEGSILSYAVPPGSPPYRINVTPRPRVGVTCRPEGGARRVYAVEPIRPRESSPAQPEAVGDTYVSYLQGRWNIENGSCAHGGRAFERWRGSRGTGLLACMDPFDGRPWIYFSFGKGRYLAFATRDDSDYDALYDWWEQLRTFLP